MAPDLPGIAAAPVARANETPSTLTRRFEAVGIPSTEPIRRPYRAMLFAAKGGPDVAGCVTAQDQTRPGRRWHSCRATPGVLTSVKVDAGAKPIVRSPDETMTERPDRLRRNSAACLVTYTDEFEETLFAGWRRRACPRSE